MMSFLSARVASAAPRMMGTRTLLMPSCRNISSIALTPPATTAQSMFTVLTTSVAPSTTGTVFRLQSHLESLLSWSTWLIKRTFQPSIIRKRRKTGLLARNKTVGGRKILKRRKQKGRARLAGC